MFIPVGITLSKRFITSSGKAEVAKSISRCSLLNINFFKIVSLINPPTT